MGRREIKRKKRHLNLDHCLINIKGATEAMSDYMHDAAMRLGAPDDAASASNAGGKERREGGKEKSRNSGTGEESAVTDGGLCRSYRAMRVFGRSSRCRQVYGFRRMAIKKGQRIKKKEEKGKRGHIHDLTAPASSDCQRAPTTASIKTPRPAGWPVAILDSGGAADKKRGGGKEEGKDAGHRRVGLTEGRIVL